jgi:hypothetical protein
MVKIRINFVDSADDATMAPDDASYQRAHLSSGSPSRFHGATLPRPTIVNAGSDTPLHLRATSIQYFLQKQ